MENKAAIEKLNNMGLRENRYVKNSELAEVTELLHDADEMADSEEAKNAECMFIYCRFKLL
jgi:hypothetical protein